MASFKSSRTSEQVNKLKYLVKWIEIQKASYNSSRTSEQTQILSQMNWDPNSFIQILENKWTCEQVNKLKYLVKWIEFQKASYNSSNTSEQVNKLKSLVKWIEILIASFKSLRTSEQVIKWTSEHVNKWTNSNIWSNELRFRKLHIIPREQVNKWTNSNP